MIKLVKMDDPKAGDICFYRCVDDRFIFCKITHCTYVDDKHMYKFVNIPTGEEESGTDDFWKVKSGKREFADEQQKCVCELQENICRLAYEEEEKDTRDKLKNLERWAQGKKASWKRECATAMEGYCAETASFCGFAVAVFDEILTRIKDGIRDTEKSKTPEQNIHEIVQKEFARLKDHVEEGIEKKNGCLIDLSIVETERNLYEMIESSGQQVKNIVKEEFDILKYADCFDPLVAKSIGQNINKRIENLFGSSISEEFCEQTENLGKQTQDVIRKKFAELRKHICEEVPEKNTSTFLIGSRVNAAEYELNVSIESLFASDTTTTQHKE